MPHSETRFVDVMCICGSRFSFSSVNQFAGVSYAWLIRCGHRQRHAGPAQFRRGHIDISGANCDYDASTHTASGSCR